MLTRRLNRLAAVLVAAAMVGAPALASAAPALRTSAAAVPSGAARDGYAKGRTSYDAGEYAAAGRTWAALLNEVPEMARNRGLRAGIILDTITAYRAAYDETGDVAHLEAALDNYYRYFETYRDTYSSPNIPRPVVDARFALKDAIAAAKRSDSNAAPTDSGGSNESGAGPNPSTPPAAGSPPPPPNPNQTTLGHSFSTADSPKSPRTPLIASGAVLIALGAGASSMIAVGAVEGQRAREDQKLPGYTDEQRDRIDRRGKSMNSLLIAGAVITPALIGTGIALLAVGLTKPRNPRTTAQPTVTRHYAGLTLTTHF